MNTEKITKAAFDIRGQLIEKAEAAGFLPDMIKLLNDPDGLKCINDTCTLIALGRSEEFKQEMFEKVSEAR